MAIVRTVTYNADGSLTVLETLADGTTPGKQWTIGAANVRQHRRDAAFDTEVKAALSPADLTKLAAADKVA